MESKFIITPQRCLQFRNDIDWGKCCTQMFNDPKELFYIAYLAFYVLKFIIESRQTKKQMSVIGEEVKFCQIAEELTT